MGPAGNLPAELTSFVGRRPLIVAAKRLLRSQRLITLTGAAGIGKTRLALRVAAQSRNAFAYGAWLVELTAIEDAGLLAQTVADTLGLRDRSGVPVIDTLLDSLRGKQLLLVLDDCQHQLNACATLASTLLRAAPRLRILATSREPLHISGEHLLTVPPLSMPDPDPHPVSHRLDHYEAVRLFVDRASANRPGFCLNASNRVAIARLCHRLDGVPLAIELAALRVRALSPAQILDRLDDYLATLTAGSHIAVPRLQTLHAAIGWSFTQCSDHAQRLWMRVSIFAGGFDLDTADAVCTGHGIPQAAILDLVTELLDKSIITRTYTDAATVRYRMLEPIRQYGLATLRKAGEEATLRHRYRQHYLHLAEQGEREWFGPHQVEWSTRLHTEQANLRAALDSHLTEPAAIPDGLRLATCLWFYWTACGSLREGRYWLDRALALNPQPTPARTKGLWVQGRMAIFHGDLPAAEQVLSQCRALATRLGDAHALAYGTQMLGVARLLAGDVREAEALLQEAIVAHRANHELNSLTLLAHIQLATARVFQGHPKRAIDLCENCRAISENHGERWVLSYALHTLALAQWTRGDWDLAAAHELECLRLKKTFNDTVGMTMALELLAWITAGQGAGERTAVLLGAAQRSWQDVGLPLFGSSYFMAHHETCVKQARQLCGDDGYATAFQHGHQLTLIEAADYATGNPDPRHRATE